MAESELLYKLISLQLLSLSGQPLTRTQMTDFFLEKGYADYFTIRPILYDLEESRLIVPGSGNPPDGAPGTVMSVSLKSSGTAFVISEEGKRTLTAYQDRITRAIRSDVEEYLRAHSVELHLARDVQAGYDRSTDGGYLVSCRAYEDGRRVLSLELRVGDAAQAEAICYNWKVRYMDLYAQVMDTLLG